MGKKKWKAKKLEKKNKKEEETAQADKKYQPKDKKIFNQRDKNVFNKSSKNEGNDSDDEFPQTNPTRKNIEKSGKKKSGGFQSMCLSYNVYKGILRRGYKLPTPIQRKTIPLILEGKDVVAMARTGSGKTAAFLIPLFEKLKVRSSQGARAIIFSPTRELAVQTLQFAKELGKFTGLKAAVILGGDSMDSQFAALHEKPDIIIATPGRLLHVLMEMEMRLKSIEYAVFDEADRLFEMGFADQLQEIIHRLSESRQTVLFSATLPKQLVEFARAGLTDPTLIRLDIESKLSENLRMAFLSCRENEKYALLFHMLKFIIKPTEQTVIFAATKHHVEFLNLLLTLAGFSVTYIYSSLDQAARKINAAKFSLGHVQILLVTDLAARGIDVPLLDNVINFNFPAKSKLFVHRVGRVARAGRSGRAYSLVSADEMAHMVDLHTFLGRPLKLVGLDGKVEDGEDASVGEAPQSLIDDQQVEVERTIRESVELTALTKVCANAYSKYAKSRPHPAPDSIKRVKAMSANGLCLGIHPMFASFQGEETGTRLEMINALKNFKPKTTILEINSTAKKSGFEVMKAKRSMHEVIIQRREKKRSEFQQEASRAGAFTPTAPAADQTEIDRVFDEVVTSKKSSKKKNKQSGSEEVKDQENYIQYTPADYASERGLSIGNPGTFEREAAGAVLDFTDDANDQSKKKRKWDRKRKKFVTEGSDNAAGKSKKIKTESGAYIAASYKSNAYKDWKNRNKKGDYDSDGEQKGKSSGGKFTVVGMQKRRGGHTQGMEGAQTKREKGMKFKVGKGGKGQGRLKRPEQILKERKIKAKKENYQKFRTAQRAKKGKGGGGKGKR